MRASAGSPAASKFPARRGGRADEIAHRRRVQSSPSSAPSSFLGSSSLLCCLCGMSASSAARPDAKPEHGPAGKGHARSLGPHSSRDDHGPQERGSRPSYSLVRAQPWRASQTQSPGAEREPASPGGADVRQKSCPTFCSPGPRLPPRVRSARGRERIPHNRGEEGAAAD